MSAPLGDSIAQGGQTGGRLGTDFSLGRRPQPVNSLANALPISTTHKASSQIGTALAGAVPLRAADNWTVLAPDVATEAQRSGADGF